MIDYVERAIKARITRTRNLARKAPTLSHKVSLLEKVKALQEDLKRHRMAPRCFKCDARMPENHTDALCEKCEVSNVRR